MYKYDILVGIICCLLFVIIIVINIEPTSDKYETLINSESEMQPTVSNTITPTPTPTPTLPQNENKIKKYNEDMISEIEKLDNKIYNLNENYNTLDYFLKNKQCTINTSKPHVQFDNNLHANAEKYLNSVSPNANYELDITTKHGAPQAENYAF